MSSQSPGELSHDYVTSPIPVACHAGAAVFPATDISEIPCRVCGAKSSGFHFGAITCEGCKVSGSDGAHSHRQRLRAACMVAWPTGIVAGLPYMYSDAGVHIGFVVQNPDESVIPSRLRGLINLENSHYDYADIEKRV